jgi:hypothetical protein
MSGSRKGMNKRNQEVSEFLKGLAGLSIPANRIRRPVPILAGS